MNPQDTALNARSEILEDLEAGIEVEVERPISIARPIVDARRHALAVVVHLR